MSTLVADDLPAAMADVLTRTGADLDNETACTAALARGSEFLMSEIALTLPEAMAIAEMQQWCARESLRLGADIAAELKR